VPAGIKTLGILGAGHTARMLAAAGRRRGLECVLLGPRTGAGTTAAAHHIPADWGDEEALKELGRRADVISVEPETVPVSAVRALRPACPAFPPVGTLTVSQDRLRAKQWMQSLQIPVARFRPVRSRPQLLEAVEQFGFPCMLKTRLPVIDGKRQAVLRFREDLERAWQELGDNDLICERFVRCDAEYAVIAVRGGDGQRACWPLTRKLHRNGALAVCLAPVPDSRLQAQAEMLAGKLLDSLNHVGVLVLELFSRDGDLLANEFVPGPHDSADWTVDGATGSQFENHLNALTGAPLADTGLSRRSLTFSLTATPPGEAQRRDLPANTYWHVNDEKQHPGCKIGHVTVTAKSEAGLRARAAQLAESLGVSAELDLEAILG